MIIFEENYASNGAFLFLDSGAQKLPQNLDSYSGIMSNLRIDTHRLKYCVGICWESKNIYYANYYEDVGFVRKISYNGDLINEYSCGNPVCLSIIQNSTKVNSYISNPPQEEIGCWIGDSGLRKAIKIDKNLEFVGEVTGIVSPIGIAAFSSGGCIVYDDYTKNLISINNNFVVVDVFDLSNLVPSFNNFVAIKVDANDRIWIASREYVYSFYNEEGKINQGPIAGYFGANVYPPDLYSGTSSTSSSSSMLSSLSEEPMIIGDFDIDRNSDEQYLYVGRGNGSSCTIYKYNSGGNLVNEQSYDTIDYPYIVRAVQSLYSDGLYVLSDTERWQETEYASSSSNSTNSSSSSTSSSSDTPYSRDAELVDAVYPSYYNGYYSLIDGAGAGTWKHIDREIYVFYVPGISTFFIGPTNDDTTDAPFYINVSPSSVPFATYIKSPYTSSPGIGTPTFIDLSVGSSSSGDSSSSSEFYSLSSYSSSSSSSSSSQSS